MDEALIKKVMPHSIDAEKSVIGSMLMDQEAITAASEILIKDDFYGKQYGILYDAMVQLFKAGKPVDLVTLQNKLKEMDVPPELSSVEFLREILSQVFTSANIKHYANIVKQKAMARNLIRTTENIANTCYLEKAPLEDILTKAEKDIFKIVQSQGGGEFVPIRQVVINTLEKIEAAAKNKGSVTGIPTGFTDLDYQTAGLQPSDLILVAARPSMGKTAFVFNIAVNMAFKKDVTVSIFS